MAMKIDLKNPPRSYEVGRTVKLQMKDCGTIRLEPDEQLTFTTEAGAEYDLARKDWGFYATPSLNGRLQQFGLRAVLGEWLGWRGASREAVLLLLAFFLAYSGMKAVFGVFM